VRKDGIRLFMIWYQILQDRNDTENHEMFSRLVSISDDDTYFTFSDRLDIPTAKRECFFGLFFGIILLALVVVQG